MVIIDLAIQKNGVLRCVSILIESILVGTLKSE
jgi:hypothetical protein